MLTSKTSPGVQKKAPKWYDLDYDRDLIAQSIAKQYGILPSAQSELHYSEWALLVGGLMEDTPLGRVVLIRKEDDPERLKNFTAYEHRVRNDWQRFLAEDEPVKSADPMTAAEHFERVLTRMFG